MLLSAAPSPRMPCARVSAQLPAAPAAGAHSTAFAPTGTLCAHLDMPYTLPDHELCRRRPCFAAQCKPGTMLAWLARSNEQGLRAWWSPCDAPRQVQRQGGCMHRLRPGPQRTLWLPVRSAALPPTLPLQSRFQLLAPKRQARLAMAAERSLT